MGGERGGAKNVLQYKRKILQSRKSGHFRKCFGSVPGIGIGVVQVWIKMAPAVDK